LVVTKPALPRPGTDSCPTGTDSLAIIEWSKDGHEVSTGTR